MTDPTPITLKEAMARHDAKARRTNRIFALVYIAIGLAISCMYWFGGAPWHVLCVTGIFLVYGITDLWKNRKP